MENTATMRKGAAYRIIAPMARKASPKRMGNAPHPTHIPGMRWWDMQKGKLVGTGAEVLVVNCIIASKHIFNYGAKWRKTLSIWINHT